MDYHYIMILFKNSFLPGSPESREYPCEFQGEHTGRKHQGMRLCVGAVRTIRDAGVHMHAAGYGSDYRLTGIHMSDM